VQVYWYVSSISVGGLLDTDCAVARPRDDFHADAESGGVCAVVGS
jgi:hypothetical protein